VSGEEEGKEKRRVRVHGVAGEDIVAGVVKREEDKRV